MATLIQWFTNTHTDTHTHIHIYNLMLNAQNNMIIHVIVFLVIINNEFNAHLKQIKVILSTVKTHRIFVTCD